MNEKFAREIYKTIVNESCDIYKELYQNTEITEKTVAYWKNALELFRGLDDEQKEIFFSVIRQTIIDTISGVFGVIDGSSTLGNEEFEFDFCINGINTEQELQDTFLEIVEEEK